MANRDALHLLKAGVDLWNRWRDDHRENQGTPDLSNADLRGARLRRANFTATNLSGANLSGAVLEGATFLRADLRNANLTRASLKLADFSQTTLTNADLSGATIGWTNFGNTDLSRVKGLESLVHAGPSNVGVLTLMQSGGELPQKFLRDMGVPEAFVVYAHSLAVEPIQFYSCFISYSSKDQEFAERLHADLRAKGVRVWFAPHDLAIGARIRPAIDESIRLHDKLLLVLSESSVGSHWVEQEVETALAREREQDGKVVLFPVRIDGAVLESRAGWPALLKNTRNVGDFTRWKEQDSYRRAFERLLRDLKAGT